MKCIKCNKYAYHGINGIKKKYGICTKCLHEEIKEEPARLSTSEIGDIRVATTFKKKTLQKRVDDKLNYYLLGG